MASPNIDKALDVMQQMFNDVLVQTGKALRSSGKNPKGSFDDANSAVNTKIPASLKTYHGALDDLESEIVRAKSVLLRDLNQLRAKRAPVAEPQPVPSAAPPAPMEAEQDLLMLDASPATGTTQPPAGTGPSTGTETKAVAPFPNMGFDLTMSPEVPPAQIPAQEAAATGQMNPSPQPAAAQAAALGRPASAPPKKETPNPAAGTSPKSPISAATAPSLTAPLTLPATATPAPATAPTIPDPEMAFTDMAFSLAPAANDAQGQSQAAPEPEMDLGSLGAADMPENLLDLDSFDTGAGGATGVGATGPMDVTGAEGDHQGDSTNIDAEIETILNSGGEAGTDRMDMDYELEGIGLDNNNSFNELFFVGADDNPTESNDTYYGL